MHRVSKTPAALTGTPRSGDNSVGIRHVYPFLMQMLLLAFLKNFPRTANLTKIEKKSLEMFIIQATSLLHEKWRFIIQHLKDQVLRDSLHSMVPNPTKLDFDTLVKALQAIAEKHYRKMGVPVETILGCDTIVDAVNVHFLNNDVFMDIFMSHVWVFFHTDLKVANQMARMTEHLSNLSPEMVSSYAAIVARTAVTFTQITSPVAQALVPESQPSATLPDDEPVLIVRVLPDPPLRDDATDLILADVKSVLADCVANAVTMAAKSFDAGNCSTVMAITSDELDAQVLATEVTCYANEHALKATVDAIAALEVVEAVKAATDAGESVQRDMPSSTEFVPGDSEAAGLFLEIAGGPLSVISERTEDGADQSGTSSPLPPNGEVQAHFTTFTLTPLHSIEIGAPGAQTLSLADLSRSVDGSKSFSSDPGSTFSSGPSGTPPTHESSLLLAASMHSSPQSTFTPAATTSADGSNSVQSSCVKLYVVLETPNLLALLDEPPPLPSISSPMGGDMGGRGAQSSGIPIGNPPGNAQSNVGGSRNPLANLPSFPPKGDVGGPPLVQVLVQSADPSGDSGSADHPKTPSSLKLGSSCIPGEKTRSASRRQQAPQSREWWRNIFQSGKSNRVNPSQGKTDDTRPPVAHSSDNPSESAATTSPLSQTVVFPAGRTGIGGSGSSQDGTDLTASLPPPNLFGTNGKPVRPLPPTPVNPPSRRTGIGGSSPAHSPGNPPEIVPPPAPSLSYELGSAATPAAPPLTNKPSTSWGTDIGGTKRSGEMQDIAMVLLLGAHLLHLGVPLAQVPLFSRIQPAHDAQVAAVA